MKLLVILSRVPYPLEKGDKLRAYHQIRCLSKYHQITLIALTDQKVHPQAKDKLLNFCDEVYFLKLNKGESTCSHGFYRLLAGRHQSFLISSFSLFMKIELQNKRRIKGILFQII